MKETTLLIKELQRVGRDLAAERRAHESLRAMTNVALREHEDRSKELQRVGRDLAAERRAHESLRAMTNVALREHEDRSEYLQMRIHNLRESIDHWMSVVRMLADGEIGPDHSMVRRAFDGPSRLSCESGAAKSKGSIE